MHIRINFPLQPVHAKDDANESTIWHPNRVRLKCRGENPNQTEGYKIHKDLN